MDVGTWELLSYVVTTIGLPLAILVFIYEQKKERDNEEEEVYQLLSDNYEDFLKTALEHPDLQLFHPEQTPELTDEQRERMLKGSVHEVVEALHARSSTRLRHIGQSPGRRRAPA